MPEETKKAKNQQKEIAEDPDSLVMAPPDTRYLSEVYIVEIPLGDKHFESPWKLRVYAEKVLERRLGDNVQVTAVKVKKPHALAKTKARLLKREPTAKLHVTVKF